MALTLSENAVQQVRELKQTQNLPENPFLGASRGGCRACSNRWSSTREGTAHREFEMRASGVGDKKSYST